MSQRPKVGDSVTWRYYDLGAFAAATAIFGQGVLAAIPMRRPQSGQLEVILQNLSTSWFQISDLNTEVNGFQLRPEASLSFSVDEAWQGTCWAVAVGVAGMNLQFALGIMRSA